MFNIDRLFQIEDLSLLWQSTIGIEREGLRVQSNGHLSSHPHSPFWGQRDHQPYIQTDFAESQLELITPPVTHAQEALNWLASEHQIVASHMAQHDELLWPFSSPPYIPADESQIKIAQLSNQKEFAYRDYLAHKYGKPLQLLSGIHYNIQLNPLLLAQLYQELNESELSFVSFTNTIYMKLARNYLRYRWLVTYLWGAAPFVDTTFYHKLVGKPTHKLARSWRQSRYGYYNDKKVQISYQSIEAFVQTLESAVANKDLCLEKELYRDIRLRGQASAAALLSQGIGYVELRNIDLNPLTPYGISEDQINFIKLFILSLLFIPDCQTDEAVVYGNQLNHQIAESSPFEPLSQALIKEGKWLFEHLYRGAKKLNQSHISKTSLIELIKNLEKALAQPHLTLAGQVVPPDSDFDSYINTGLALAKSHQTQYLSTPYALHGFTQFELSTQDIIKHAISAGIQVEIIDPQDNLLKLTYQGQSNFVRNGNMTALDPMISYFLLENKLATKTILNQAGINVPKGAHYQSFESAFAAYGLLDNQGVVIKPNNTNYGVGITIFTHKPKLDEYEAALKFAFASDKSVLVESYFEGTELRFYVQQNQVLAVCERQPAQVIGDGEHTISQLVAIENQNPQRGKKHFAPLTLIDLKAPEIQHLNEQGLSINSIPAVDECIYLRANSNVSTGGIPIDRTEEVHPAYCQAAIKAAQALGANICGIDMLISDYRQDPSKIDHAYVIIEANFNPMMALHLFPAIGKARPVSRKILLALFPNCPI